MGWVGRNGRCRSNVPLLVEIGHVARNVDPCRDELFYKNGCFRAVDSAVGERRALWFTDANFHHIWTTGWEVIGS